MKTKTILLLLLFIFSNTFSQENSGLNSWSVGVGLTNTLVHGDLTSVNNLNKDFLNSGFYLSINKMITPVVGIELKGQTLSLKGFSQELSSGYPIAFTNYNNGELYFEGDSFGAELNIVINLSGFSSNPYNTENRKFNFSTYFGLGYHTYNTELYSFSELDGVGFSYTPIENLNKGSLYFNTGIGIRYNLTKRLDLELKQNFSFNRQDDLDSAITNKQAIESFFTTQLGLVIKLQKKDNTHITWQNTLQPEKIEDIDSDLDGVVDRFDKEENTPKGALVYADGSAVDSDKDGIIDFYDKCPLKKGIKDNKGCPIDKTIDTDGDSVFDYLDKEKETPKGAKVDKDGVALDTDGDNTIDLYDKCVLLKGKKDSEGCPKDTDKDGVFDINDLCPTIAGNKENKGCPNPMSETDNLELLRLAKNIYFESGKFYLRESSKRQLEKVFEIIENNPGLKFIIGGHTDSGGKHDYNLKLSQNRVNTVKSYLVRLGVKPNRLKSVGYGFTKPQHTNESSKGRQLNRRVEIFVDDNSITEMIKTKTYIVKKKDTLFSIAKKNNITVEQLKLWNVLTSNNILVGSRLIIQKQ